MRRELEALVREVCIARIVAGTVLGILIGAAMLVGSAIAAGPAAAQDGSALWVSRSEVVQELAAHYTETPTQTGVTSGGAIIELFTAPDGTTWTLVLTLPSGMSRVIATGEDWMMAPAAVPGSVS